MHALGYRTQKTMSGQILLHNIPQRLPPTVAAWLAPMKESDKILGSPPAVDGVTGSI